MFLCIKYELKRSEIFPSASRGTVTEMTTINYTAYTDIVTLKFTEKCEYRKKIHLCTYIYTSQLPLHSLVLTEGLLVQLKRCCNNKLF